MATNHVLPTPLHLLKINPLVFNLLNCGVAERAYKYPTSDTDRVLPDLGQLKQIQINKTIYIYEVKKYEVGKWGMLLISCSQSVARHDG